MLTRFRQWLAPPVFENDETKTRKAGLLNSVLVASVAAILTLIGGGLLGKNIRPFALAVLGAALIVLFGLRWLMRRGHIAFTSVACSLALSFFTTLALASQGTMRAPGIVFFVLASVIAGLLVNRPAAIGSAVL